MNNIEKLREKMNYFKNSGMKDPFKELSFFILSWHEFMKMRKQNKGITFNIINWLHSNTTVQMYTQR